MSNAAPLSGHQYTISHGDYSATIASVGASLRLLTFAGRDLVYAAVMDGEQTPPGIVVADKLKTAFQRAGLTAE